MLKIWLTLYIDPWDNWVDFVPRSEFVKSFDRHSLKYLLKWKTSSRRKPLIIRGARQVGKTTLVNLFSQDFQQYLYFNLEKKEDLDLFEMDIPFKDLLVGLFLSRSKLLNNTETLVFIDEIQHSRAAMKNLRYFFEDYPHLHVIAAGSLLESMLVKNFSFPVGRVEYHFMYPLHFREFLEVTGQTMLAEKLTQIPLNEVEHHLMIKAFHKFVLIGGMPEAVKVWNETHDLVEVNGVYQNLLITYAEDVVKYAKSESQAQIIRHIIQTVPYEIGNRIKYEGFGNSGYRSKPVSEAIRTLEKTMLISMVKPTTSVSLPLMPDQKKAPKVLFLDSGLVNYQLGIQMPYLKADDLCNIYKGVMAEHIVGLELRKLFGQSNKRLLFWVRDKNQSSAEVDYIVQITGTPVPIEVKLGKTGRLRSLHQFMDQSEATLAVRIYGSEYQVTTCRTMRGKQYTLINLPYYLTGQIMQCVEKVLTSQ